MGEFQGGRRFYPPWWCGRITTRMWTWRRGLQDGVVVGRIGSRGMVGPATDRLVDWRQRCVVLAAAGAAGPAAKGALKGRLAAKLAFDLDCGTRLLVQIRKV